MQTCGVDYRTAYLVVGEAVRRGEPAGAARRGRRRRDAGRRGRREHRAAAGPGRPGPIRGAGPAADRGDQDPARRRGARRRHQMADAGRGGGRGLPTRPGAGGTPTRPPRRRWCHRPPRRRGRWSSGPAGGHATAAQGADEAKEHAMTEPACTPLSLPDSVGVVNVGLPLFADAVRASRARGRLGRLADPGRRPARRRRRARQALRAPGRADRAGQRRGAPPPRHGHPAADRDRHGGEAAPGPGRTGPCCTAARPSLAGRPAIRSAARCGPPPWPKGWAASPEQADGLLGAARSGSARPTPTGGGADGDGARAGCAGVRGWRTRRAGQPRYAPSRRAPARWPGSGCATRAVHRPAGVPARRRRAGASNESAARRPARSTSWRSPPRRSRWATTSMSVPRPRRTC